MNNEAIPARLADAFRGRARGSLHVDRVTRRLYATDASPYSIDPAAVFRAAEVDDLAVAIEICVAEGVPITARGAGTSLSGQCVGGGLNLDLSALDRIISIDPDAAVARVEPGVRWWQLDRAAAAHGLEFGPDPATRRQCTIGGMVASNSGGTHSIVYGAAVDHVRSIDVLLADGSNARFGEETHRTVRSAGAPAPLAEDLERIRAETAPLLGPRFFTLSRRGSGYLLEHLCGERLHLGKLLAGAEGTLGVMTEIELTLSKRPLERVLAVIGFLDMHSALALVPELVATSPSAVEIISRSMLQMARRDPFHRARVAGVPADVDALLFVEYQGDAPGEATAGFERMAAVLDRSGDVSSLSRFIDPLDCARMWGIREAGIGAMSAVAAGPLLPQAFVEDTIVAVDRLPGYIREFADLFHAHDMEPVWYGHASTGLIHVRPFLDMTSATDLVRLESLMVDSVDLVRAWGGDLCGEHGDGLSRTYWNERLFGPEIYAQMKALKRAFDPTGLLNPGKVVEGPHPLENLRYGPGYRRTLPTVRFDYADQGGYAAAVERCFGVGLCRKRDVGTMCPPAAASGLEEHSTRARANLLRSVMAGDLAMSDLSGPVAREVMDTCIACKACKVECPARVDMARLKAEWADRIRRADGATTLQRSIARLRGLSALAAPVAPLSNRILASKAMRRRLGIAPQRRLPSFARRPLTRRLRAATADVRLFADCFTTYQEPRIGEAAVQLLRAAGRRAAVVNAGCCGRVMISEGYIERARRAARKASKTLRAASGPILFCEPSCMSAVTDDWPNLIGDVSDIVERCSLAEEFVAVVAVDLAFEPGGRVLLHGHCHQKALWGMGGTERAIRLVPDVTVEMPDAGCCGMAGAFGYRADRYELSVAMGERVLAPAVRAAPDAELVATGTSCRHQIADLTGRRPSHPLEFLASRLRT